MRSGFVSLAALLLCAFFSVNLQAAEPYEEIKQKEIDEMTFDDVEDDGGVAGAVAANLEHLCEDRKKRLDELREKIESWEPGKEEAIGQRVRNLLCLCAVADICQSEFEAEIPYIVFEYLKKEISKEKLEKACAWVLLKPDDGKVVDKAPDLGFEDGAAEMLVRERAPIFAKKLLGRVVGKLPPKQEAEKK